MCKISKKKRFIFFVIIYQVEFVLSLSGSTAGSMLSFILPSAMYIISISTPNRWSFKHLYVKDLFVHVIQIQI
jgi:hypothetical protein